MDKKIPFENFYNQFYFRVFRYVHSKIGHVEDAEDLTCDAFLYCYDHFSEYDPQKASIGTWLYLVVNSRIKNYYRDKKEFFELDSFQEILADENICMERALQLEDTRQMLARGLKTLSPTQREIVILRYFYECDTNTVAQRLGLQPGNVRTTLSRALDRLEKYFKAHGMQNFMPVDT